MVNIVCIGDSIVEGEGDESGRSGWVGRLQQHVLKDSPVGENRVYNLGVGMETTMDLRHRLFSEVPYRDPDVIILQAAHGDSRLMANNAGDEEFEVGKKARLRAYHKMFEYLSQCGKHVLILGLNPLSDNPEFSKAFPKRAEHIEKHNEGLKEQCAEYKLNFLDPRDMFDGDLDAYYVDGLHPNARGYDRMFEAISSKLQELKYI